MQAAKMRGRIDEAYMKVVTISRTNVGQVARWRGERSGIRTYLQALIDGEWCQVVETRSEPDCLPPRRLRLRGGEFTWAPPTTGPQS